jgi:outer membrane protein assembly factor BamB
MRFVSDRRPRSRTCIRAGAALCLLALSACFDGSNPFAPRGGNVGEVAFGASSLAWFTPDSAGGWTMVPLLNGSHVYFERDMQVANGQATAPPEMLALDRATGQEQWHTPMTTAENAVMAGGRLGAVWGSLSIFDPANGARLHTYRFGETSLNANVASDGARFYTATHDGHAVSVNPATGAAVWTTSLAGGEDTPGFGVAVSGEAVAVTLKHFGVSQVDRDTGIVAVLNRATGAVRWRTRIEGAADPGIVEPPVIVGGLVIVVTQGHDVRAFDLQTGALRWSFDASYASGDAEYGSNGIAACDGRVVVPTGNRGIAAVDAATGTLQWRVSNTDGGSLIGVQCSHGSVLALGGGLRVFDAATGARRAVYPRREPPTTGREFMITGVANDGEFLYVATTYGYAKVRAP